MAFGLHELGLIFLIFFARIIDVSIGTVRLIFVSKGLRKISAILGFFEILIWIVVVSKIMSGTNNIIYYISYAAGFAAGTYVGMKLESLLSIGKVMIRIIVHNDSEDLIAALKESNHPVTIINAEGKRKFVKVIFSVINKKELKEITSMIFKYNPKAFYSIEDVRYASSNMSVSETKRFLGYFRKGK